MREGGNHANRHGAEERNGKQRVPELNLISRLLLEKKTGFTCCIKQVRYCNTSFHSDPALAGVSPVQSGFGDCPERSVPHDVGQRLSSSDKRI